MSQSARQVFRLQTACLHLSAKEILDMFEKQQRQLD